MRAMFDTVNFWLNTLGLYKPFEVERYLKDAELRENEKEGLYIIGRIGDYKVHAYSGHILLWGSLSKYFFSSNLYTHTRQTAQQAIEKISDELHVDLRPAKVTRVDVAGMLQMNRLPSDYFACLGHKSYFTRLQATSTSLYYQTKKETLNFYDKTKQAKSKGLQIPKALIGCNLLRYEMRLLKQVQQRLKIPTFTADQLTNEKIYHGLIQLWKKKYESISKIYPISVDAQTISKPTQAKNVLLGILLQQEEQVIEEYLADLKAQKVFSDPKYYTRLKDDLNKTKAGSIKKGCGLVEELNKVIFEIAKYAE